MKTPEEYVDLWKSSVPRLADVFKIAQTEAYNQALDDPMNAEYVTGCTKTRTCEIVICTRCEGSGEVRVESDDPGYEGPWRKRCPQCNGSGRRRQVVTTEFFPFTKENRR